MSERETVLAEFNDTPDFIGMADSPYDHERMADEIIRLRAALTLANQRAEQLSALIDTTAKHWLSLTNDIRIPWEGAIDEAMRAACDKIRELTQRAEAAEAERDAALVNLSLTSEMRTHAEQFRSAWQGIDAVLGDANLPNVLENGGDLVGHVRGLVSRLAAAEAERDALRKVDDAMVGRFLRAYAECEGERPQTFTHRIGVRAALDAALAVQP